jgi:hypothetical protein
MEPAKISAWPENTPHSCAPQPSDAQLLDWLACQLVEVRGHLRYGAKRLIYQQAEWDIHEPDPTPFDIRAEIARAMREERLR